MTRGRHSSNRLFAILAIAIGVAIGCIFASTSPANSERPPKQEGSARETPVSSRVDAAKIAAIGSNIRTSSDELSGEPKLLLAQSGVLKYPTTDSPPEDLARSFISSHADLWGLQPGDVPTLVVERDFAIDGVRTIWFTQEVGGVPVFGSRVKAAFDRTGALIVLNGSVRAVLGGAAPPAHDPTFGVSRALQEVGRTSNLLGPAIADNVDGKPGASFSRGGLQAEPTTRLVLVPREDGARLAWRTNLSLGPSEQYDVLIDDETGDVLYRQNNVFEAGPEGQVFAMPNPDPDGGATPVVVPFVGALPSPHDAWLSAGSTVTAGNNAIAGEDRNGDSTPVPPTSATQQFNFGFTNDYALTQNPLTDLNAGAANGFYWVNVTHDYLYSLGFTEASGNFQADNFGLGGVAGDPIRVLVQFNAASPCTNPFPAGNCFNNAFFNSSEVDGTAASIHLLLDRPPNLYTDVAFASDVIIHEYGHGLHHRNVGGFYGQQGGALGEAWADYLGETITDDPVMGEYMSGNPELGIRRSRQDQSIALYGDMCTVVTCEAHRDGETWATTMWDIRRTMISLYGTMLGRERADKLYYLGLTLTADGPDFLDARDAIIAADVAYYSGADTCYLWNVFASRGMGDSAQSFGGTSLDTLEAFDLPPACAPAGADTDSDGMPDAFEAAHLCLNVFLNDAATDFDLDGENNLREYTLAVDPCVSNPAGMAAGSTVRVSQTTADEETINGDSYSGAMSDDGRYVAFTSVATNLTAVDYFTSMDVFVRDRDTDADGVYDESGNVKTILITRAKEPAYPGYQNFDVDISSTGRFVSFASYDFELVAGDTNDATDIFVYDRDSDADGTFDEPGATATSRMSLSTAGVEGDAHSVQSSISATGRFVTFTSGSGSLVPGDNNRMYDVYVRDRDVDLDGIFDEPGAVSTSRVSTSSAGSDANGNSGHSSVSDNGRYVVFYSTASNLVASDTNSSWDVFLRDRDTDSDGIFDEPGLVSTTRSSETPAGVQGNSLSFDPDISGNGRFVTFSSLASNFVSGDVPLQADIFLRDRDADSDGIYDEPGAVTLTRVPVGSDLASAGRKHFGSPAISRDGRTIVFGASGVRADAASIARGRDIFVYDRLANVTRQVSTHVLGSDRERNSQVPAVSGNGRYVSFFSASMDLIASDTNGYWDTFAFDRDDGDGVPWATDNCPADSNASQRQRSQLHRQQPAVCSRHRRQDTRQLRRAGRRLRRRRRQRRPAPTRNEASGACMRGQRPTNALLRDTDGDRFLDGAECALGTDPTNSASEAAAHRLRRNR